LAAVPRGGEEVELTIVPTVDPAALPKFDMSTWSRFQRFKSVLKVLILGGDRELDEAIEESVEGVEIPDGKVVCETVLRVRWTPFVLTPEQVVTAATIVLKLQDGGPQGADARMAGSPSG